MKSITIPGQSGSFLPTKVHARMKRVFILLKAAV